MLGQIFEWLWPIQPRLYQVKQNRSLPPVGPFALIINLLGSRLLGFGLVSNRLSNGGFLPEFLLSRSQIRSSSRQVGFY